MFEYNLSIFYLCTWPTPSRSFLIRVSVDRNAIGVWTVTTEYMTMFRASLRMVVLGRQGVAHSSNRDAISMHAIHSFTDLSVAGLPIPAQGFPTGEHIYT